MIGEGAFAEELVHDQNVHGDDDRQRKKCHEDESPDVDREPRVERRIFAQRFTSTRGRHGRRGRTVETFDQEMVRLEDHGEAENYTDDATGVDHRADILGP